jgi:hypothetical protein
MEELAIYLLKSAGVLAVFALIYHFLLRRLTFFQSNRWFLLFGLFASVVFPFIEITQTVYVEQTVIETPQHITYMPMAMVLDDMDSTTPTLVEQSFDYEMLWYAIYAMLALFFVGKMSLELVSLFKLIRSGEVRYSGMFLLVSLSRKLTPFSFFHYICHTRGEENLPEFDLILNHEKVHARQLHSLDVIISTVYRAVFWFNPLAWWVKKQITENLEFIADAQAKSNNTSSISYERTLLSVMACQQQPALANNFFTPFIKQRIVMLQKETSARWHAYKYALILPIIVLFLYSFNVVEEIKYVEPENESLINEVDEKSKDSFIFKIEPDATQAEIDLIAQQISNAYDYSFKIIDVSRLKGLVSKLKVRVVFPQEPENIYSFSLGKPDIAMNEILIWIDDQSLQLSEKEGFIMFEVSRSKGIELKLSETGIAAQKLEQENQDNSDEKLGSNPLQVFNGKQLLVSEMPKGTTLTCDVIKVLKPSEAIKKYGARAKDGAMVYIGKTVVTKSASIEKDNKVLIIKISAKTSQKELDKIEAQISEFDVDFKIKKAKFSGGKLVKFQFELNDRNGFEISMNDNSSDGIKNICITRRELSNKVDWKVDRCENVAMTYIENEYLNRAPVTVIGMEDDELEARLAEVVAKSKMKEAKTISRETNLQQHIAQIQQHIATLSRDSVSMATDEMKQHVALVKQHIATISQDSALNQMKVSQKEMDAVLKDLDLNIYQIQGKAMDSMKTRLLLNNHKLDSIKSNISRPMKSNNSFRSLKNVNYESTKPLFILNGKTITEAEFRNISDTDITSVNILKNENAVALYEEKGKNGVVIVTTVIGDKLPKPQNNTQSNGKWSYSTTLRNPITSTTTSSSESVFIEKEVFIGFAREDLEKYSDLVKQRGYDFKIRTFRTKGDKVVKLKVDFAGSSYTIVADEEIEKLTFQYFKDGRKPIMTSVSR